MEIIHTFGYRKYIFHSKKDLLDATSLWSTPTSQDEFETLLEKNKIEFKYEYI